MVYISTAGGIWLTLTTQAILIRISENSVCNQFHQTAQ